MMKGVAICVLVVVAMAYSSEGAISCGQVAQDLGQCVTYLTGKEPKPAAACCNGIKTLKSQVGTTDEKRQACNCIKQAAAGMKDIKDTAVTNLPTACGAPLPFPISKDFNCDTIPYY